MMACSMECSFQFRQRSPAHRPARAGDHNEFARVILYAQAHKKAARGSETANMAADLLKPCNGMVAMQGSGQQKGSGYAALEVHRTHLLLAGCMGAANLGLSYDPPPEQLETHDCLIPTQSGIIRVRQLIKSLAFGKV